MDAIKAINQGEIYIALSKPLSGKTALNALGVSDKDLTLSNGLLRLVTDLDSVQDYKFFKVPTMEFYYHQETTETHWQCDYNDHTVLDKLDHHGRSTVLLLKREVLSSLENRHNNTLIIHAEFEEPITLSADQSFIYLFN